MTETSGLGPQPILRLFEQEMGIDRLPCNKRYAPAAALDNPADVMLINRSESENNSLSLIAGIFYKGILVGCSCSDDPKPIENTTSIAKCEK